LLFVAALLPLIFANRWVYQLGAVLAGAGAGLFIDEVGKFITQNNNYFYQPAAPIIYAFFLVCVLVYLQVNQPPPRRTRHEFYAALEAIEEVLDKDLDAGERAVLQARLHFVVEQNDDPQLAHLANEMLDFLNSDWVTLVPSAESRLRDLLERFLNTEGGFLNRKRLRAILATGLGLLGVAALVNFFRLSLPNIVPDTFGHTQALRTEAGLGLSSSYLYWYSMLGVFNGITGVLLIASLALLPGRREGMALRLGFYVLLVNLTILDLLMFYYFQFDTILLAILQFVILLAVAYYRRQYGNKALWD
jgi:hypothetical protein